MSFLLEFKDVTFSYDTVPVLNHFSLSVKKGEKVAVKGDSGTGKTTFFRLLLGFERPETGTIRYEGLKVDEGGAESVRKEAAWLPQDLNIGDGLVKEVISRPFEFERNRSMSPDNGRIADVFESLGLDDSLLDKPFRELSTGQRQRVGLALCHLLDRPILLLDEPTSALDRTSKQRAIDLFYSDPERTVLSTTHDPFWLERCDRIVPLE